MERNEQAQLNKKELWTCLGASLHAVYPPGNLNQLRVAVSVPMRVSVRVLVRVRVRVRLSVRVPVRVPVSVPVRLSLRVRFQYVWCVSHAVGISVRVLVRLPERVSVRGLVLVWCVFQCEFLRVSQSVFLCVVLCVFQ